MSFPTAAGEACKESFTNESCVPGGGRQEEFACFTLLSPWCRDGQDSQEWPP